MPWLGGTAVNHDFKVATDLRGCDSIPTGSVRKMDSERQRRKLMAVRKGSSSMMQLATFFLFALGVVPLMAGGYEEIVSPVVTAGEVTFRVSSKDSSNQIFEVSAYSSSTKVKDCSVDVHGEIGGTWRKLATVSAKANPGKMWEPFGDDGQTQAKLTGLKLDNQKC
jgi:hypothetical protein